MKPSERIREKFSVQRIDYQDNYSLFDYFAHRIDKILEYLDEQAEKGSPKGEDCARYARDIWAADKDGAIIRACEQHGAECETARRLLAAPAVYSTPNPRSEWEKKAEELLNSAIPLRSEDTYFKTKNNIASALQSAYEEGRKRAREEKYFTKSGDFTLEELSERSNRLEEIYTVALKLFWPLKKKN